MKAVEVNEDFIPPEVITIKGRDGPERIVSMDYIHNEMWFKPHIINCVNCEEEFSEDTLCLHLRTKEVIIPCKPCKGFSIYKKEWLC